MRILDRYLLREFAGPFGFTVGAFTLILTSSALFEMADLLLVKRVAAQTVGELLVLRLPAVIALTVPIGILFGVMLALGRWAREHELAAIRGAGRSFTRLVLPLLVTAALLSGATYLLNEKVVPASNHSYQTIIRQVVLSNPAAPLEENVFFRATPSDYFYVGKVDRGTRQLWNILVYEVRPDAFPILVTAPQGRYGQGQWELFDGVSRELDQRGFVTRETGFARMVYHLPAADKWLAANQKTPEEMSRKELAETIQLFAQAGVDLRQMRVEYATKLSLPFAGLVFALLGAPLGAGGPRPGQRGGVAYALLVVLAYYLVLSLSRSIGINGLLPATLAAWLANGLFAGLGAFLFWQAERP
ncbi:MAG: LptF/LptG family permease [Limnochordaceae bacterium]|nr:LptF/LptG family permease [Limnochordaceae bacterium]